MCTLRLSLVGTVILALLGGPGGAVVAQDDARTSDDIPAAYIHPEVLVDADWLAERLDDPSVRVVDARADNGSFLYRQGHIPGAIFVDIWGELCCPSDIMDAEPFAELMGEKALQGPGPGRGRARLPCRP